MQLSSISIRNYRSIRALDVDFCEVTSLLGSNNAGKSSILRALQIFFEAAPKLNDDDYYHRRAEGIRISVVFKNLVPAEIAEFGAAVSNGVLSVTRTFRQDLGRLSPPLFR
ncbi:AAA family ATPase [Paracoccus actinidiae]|uniref:AAA family ATPase n=1 Tax=Paracoccus actinidiae TaxID=3064531 RepID=UPI00359C4701